ATLAADATLDVVIDIRAVKREVVSGTTPLVIRIQHVKAGRDADVELLDSVEELDVGNSGYLEVQLATATGITTSPLWRTPAGNAREGACFSPGAWPTPGSTISGCRARSGWYRVHFSPDPAGPFEPGGDMIGALGSGRTTIAWTHYV